MIMNKKPIRILFLLVLMLAVMTACSSKDSKEAGGNDASLAAKASEETEKSAADYDANLIAKAKTGQFVGLEKAGIISFKGIPYAEPPVGALRWHEPVSCQPSDKIIEAYQYGLAAIQPQWHTEEASSFPQGEDCLTLNIWTKSLEPDKAKPVMVWIHGGALGWGGTVDPLYDGRNFVQRRDDVVLVSINYRVGILGFMDLSRFGEEYKNSSNLGLLDQVAALQWVRDNIEAFGGDPDNVTIFGESSGGASVALLLTTESAKGLFDKAIIQSGSAGYQSAQATGSENSNEITEMLLKNAEADTIEDLLNLSEEELVALSYEITGNDYLNSATRDGTFIPKDPWQVLIDGGVSTGVPLLVGCNADEDKYNILEAKSYEVFEEWTLGGWEDESAQMTDEELTIADKYFSRRSGLSKVEQITALGTEAGERARAIKMAEYHSKNAPTYMYYWNIPSSFENVGACHAVELAYVLYNLDEDIFTGKPIDAGIAGKVQDAWVNFAVNGNPSTDTAEWPKYDTENRSTMVISADKWYVEDDPLSEDRILVEPLFKKYKD